MSTDAPPPPPGDVPESVDDGGTTPTAAVPFWKPTTQKVAEAGHAEERTGAATRTVQPVSFDADVLSADVLSADLPTLAVPATSTVERPHLRETAPRAAGVRRVRLSISRVDPWSVMKLAFLLSVAIGIMMVVGAALVWSVLDSMEVFGKIEELLTELRVPALLQLMDFAHFDSVISIATLIAVLDIVLLTALATIMALLYNITAALVGGVHVTMVDD